MITVVNYYCSAFNLASFCLFSTCFVRNEVSYAFLFSSLTLHKKYKNCTSDSNILKRPNSLFPFFTERSNKYVLCVGLHIFIRHNALTRWPCWRNFLEFFPTILKALLIKAGRTYRGSSCQRYWTVSWMFQPARITFPRFSFVIPELFSPVFTRILMTIAHLERIHTQIQHLGETKIHINYCYHLDGIVLRNVEKLGKKYLLYCTGWLVFVDIAE